MVKGREYKEIYSIWATSFWRWQNFQWTRAQMIGYISSVLLTLSLFTWCNTKPFMSSQAHGSETKSTDDWHTYYEKCILASTYRPLEGAHIDDDDDEEEEAFVSDVYLKLNKLRSKHVIYFSISKYFRNFDLVTQSCPGKITKINIVQSVDWVYNYCIFYVLALCRWNRSLSA